MVQFCFEEWQELHFIRRHPGYNWYRKNRLPGFQKHEGFILEIIKSISNKLQFHHSKELFCCQIL